MPDSDWLDVTLGDFVTLQRGHDLPDRDRRPGLIPILGSFGVTGYHDEPRAPGPGVTVGRSGASFGVVSYSAIPFWPLNTALYVRDFHGNDERFAYYFLRCLDFKRFNSGSAQPSLNRNFIHPIEVKVPPVPEQRTIAAILGAIDDKIELNRKMSATLEAMARTLFKSWFVDFDPVHAKAEGRDPGLPAEIAALFSDSFEDSEYGAIPKGWKIQRIAELGAVTTGKTPSTLVAENFTGPYPFITIPDLDGRMFIDNTSRTLSERGANAIKGSRLPAGAVMMSCIATVGCCGITERASFTNQQINAVTCNSSTKPEFLYWTFKDLRQEIENAGGGGSVYTNVSKSRFANIPLLVPPLALQSIFASPWFKRMKCCVRENETLKQLLDSLLPKLISGELRVTDAERILEKSA
jgi:type I restriction enzyme S subunit